MVESGYLAEDESEISFSTGFTDIEIIRITSTNILVRAKRYGRQWLLKGLPESLRHSTTARRQLMKEFEIHSRLIHPGIVKMMTCEEIENLGQCIVMEWVDGETLQNYLMQDNRSFSERRRLLHEIVEAVEYLHSSGIVHRDLKPSNIMIRRVGMKVVIIDFGLADSDDYVELKQAAGTLGYVSPEQIERGGADPADDIFSLGVIIRMLCPEYSRIASLCQKPAGKRPKDGATLMKMLISKRKRPRIILMTLLIVCLAVLIVGGGMAIFLLQQGVNKASNANASLITTNKQVMAANEASHAKVTQLSDSLMQMTSRVASMEEEKKVQEEYQSKLSACEEKGKKKIESLIKRFDGRVMRAIKSRDLIEYGNAFSEFYEVMPKEIERIASEAAKEGISKEDCDKMNQYLYNYYLKLITEISSNWKWVTDDNLKSPSIEDDLQ